MKWWTFDNSCFICSHTLIIIPELNMQLCIKRRSTCCWFHNLVCFASMRQQKLTYPILTQHIQQIINQTSLNCVSRLCVLESEPYLSVLFLNCISELYFRIIFAFFHCSKKIACWVLIISGVSINFIFHPYFSVVSLNLIFQLYL